MSWLSNLFGGNKNNPANAAMPYLNQIPGRTAPYLQPYAQAGQNALSPLQDQYSKLLSDPGALMNQFGKSYQQSPGMNFAIQQALQGAGHAAAAHGMAHSPEHEQQNMQLAHDIANQDYNNYMNNMLHLYGAGLSGQQGMAQMGQQSGMSMADMIAQTLAQQANLGFRGQQEQNSMHNSFLGGLGRLGGAALGGLAGGPWGAFAGWKLSQ